MRQLFIVINGLFCLSAAGLGLWCLHVGSWGLLVSIVTLPAALASAVCLLAGKKPEAKAAKVVLALFSTLLILGGMYFASIFESQVPLLLLVPGVFNLLYLSGGFRKTPAPGPDAGQRDARPESASVAAQPPGMTREHPPYAMPVFVLFVLCMNIFLAAATLYYLAQFLYFAFSYAYDTGTIKTAIPFFFGKPSLIVASILRLMAPVIAGLCAYSAYTGKLRGPAGIYSLILLGLTLLNLAMTFDHTSFSPLRSLLFRGPWLINSIYFFPFTSFSKKS
jgi:hypothetical protein